ALMIERLLSFLKNLPAMESGREEAGQDDPRVAAAALMFHVMDADGDRDAGEHERLEQAIANAYGVEGGQLKAILSAAEEADREAVDLYAFTSVLNRHLDKQARLDFIGILWDIVYADGVFHEVEDNVVWRVAELIG